MVEAKIDPEKKVLFLLVFLALVGGIYGTYAYFSAQGQSSTQTVTTGTMELTFTDNSEIINAINIAPIVESDVLTKATKKSFSVKNTGSIDSTMTISLSSIDITENLKSPDFRWALYEEGVKIAEDSFDKLGINTSFELKTNIEIASNVTKSYDLYIWINETGMPQDELQEGNLTGTITATSEQ